ncbi:PREDICTED: probable deoxycytidylate deaminase [Rhagoletis zephyria]|uniref:probable deoxycytidylate deaminase n=1 Tax=Rhagoletis zephyria TaxID=28612 RepID=UPI0008114313|nr:PREDICTED: probable deoxycytidylate deaminase [Rhagoletis zephyria]XP_017485075.1 PREDICTED: probable deoxycytidylate deaminase [Rhagoletis zephyria]
MTGHELPTTPNSNTSNAIDSSHSSPNSNGNSRINSDSSDASSPSPFRSRSPSPLEYENKEFVNLLTDKKFHDEIVKLVKKRVNFIDNHDQYSVTIDQNRIVNVGNNDLLTNHEFLMDIALLASTHSEDPKTKVGACIVDSKNRIVGIGYNHFPPNYTNQPYPWGKDKDKLKNKLTYVIHAESDAIIGPQPNDLHGATIYSTLMPCNECAKLIIQSGIRKVYYLNSKLFEKWIYKASRNMLQNAHVTLQKLEQRTSSPLEDCL